MGVPPWIKTLENLKTLTVLTVGARYWVADGLGMLAMATFRRPACRSKTPAPGAARVVRTRDVLGVAAERLGDPVVAGGEQVEATTRSSP